MNGDSHQNPPDSGSDPTDPKAANRAKFELELEFVQSLANPFYLHSLAQQNILEQPSFINFLQYLLYFKEKDYARFIQSELFQYNYRRDTLTSLTAIHMHFITSSYSSMLNFGPR